MIICHYQFGIYVQFSATAARLPRLPPLSHSPIFHRFLLVGLSEFRQVSGHRLASKVAIHITDEMNFILFYLFLFQGNEILCIIYLMRYVYLTD